MLAGSESGSNSLGEYLAHENIHMLFEVLNTTSQKRFGTKLTDKYFSFLVSTMKTLEQESYLTGGSTTDLLNKKTFKLMMERIQNDFTTHSERNMFQTNIPSKPGYDVSRQSISTSSDNDDIYKKYQEVESMRSGRADRPPQPQFAQQQMQMQPQFAQQQQQQQQQMQSQMQQQPQQQQQMQQPQQMQTQQQHKITENYDIKNILNEIQGRLNTLINKERDLDNKMTILDRKKESLQQEIRSSEKQINKQITEFKQSMAMQNKDLERKKAQLATQEEEIKKKMENLNKTSLEVQTKDTEMATKIRALEMAEDEFRIREEQVFNTILNSKTNVDNKLWTKTIIVDSRHSTESNNYDYTFEFGETISSIKCIELAMVKFVPTIRIMEGDNDKLYLKDDNEFCVKIDPGIYKPSELAQRLERRICRVSKKKYIVKYEKRFIIESNEPSKHNFTIISKEKCMNSFLRFSKNTNNKHLGEYFKDTLDDYVKIELYDDQKEMVLSGTYLPEMSNHSVCVKFKKKRSLSKISVCIKNFQGEFVTNDFLDNILLLRFQ